MGDVMVERRFLGVGVGEYECPTHVALDHAVPELERLSKILGPDWVGEILENPSDREARDRLNEIPSSFTRGGALVFVWSGHGTAELGPLRLLTRDSEAHRSSGILIDDVVAHCAESGASQILLILDTCRSGAGADALTVAERVLTLVPPESRTWVGVLASCSAVDYARDGLFGQRLLRLLSKGPQGGRNLAFTLQQWAPYNEFLHGDAIGGALLDEWDTTVQSPVYRRDGVPTALFRNPLFDPGAPEAVVEHLLRAARGGGKDEDRAWFTGRGAELGRVVSWIVSGRPGLRVVTGAPGTGKSAIAGRVVSLSNPTERAAILGETGGFGDCDPGERSVHANIHARALTLEQAAAQIDGQLVNPAVDVLRPEGRRRNAALLVGQLQRNAEDGRPVPTIVVDGLDEAGGEAFTLARELLVPLARYAVVIVTTRNVRNPSVPPGWPGDTLLNALGASEVVDLDDPEPRASGADALREYVIRRLTGISESMDPAPVAEYLVSRLSDLGARPFLQARVATDQLRAVAVDTSGAEWRSAVEASLGQVFATDVANVAPPAHRELARPLTPESLARRLLLALTFSFGRGFPMEEWVEAGSALAGVELTERDVFWVLDELGRYIVQDGEEGVAVYRLAHQSLADRVWPPLRPGRPDPWLLEAKALVAARMLRRYLRLVTGGRGEREDGDEP